MSGKGECLDNAVAESFFGTLKTELLSDQPGARFASKTQAALLVGDYIDNFYNSIRKHSALGTNARSLLSWRIRSMHNSSYLPVHFLRASSRIHRPLPRRIFTRQRAPGASTAYQIEDEMPFRIERSTYWRWRPVALALGRGGYRICHTVSLRSLE
jgi:hypothetical protein